MKSDCDKMKDRIADLITGILPEQETQALQQHFSECSACRNYAESLEQEEQLLARFFGAFSTDMTTLEGKAIDAIERFEWPRRTGVVSVGEMIMKNFLMKYAAAAVLIAVVALYFIITLTYISQINECIRLAM
ncbi:MAG: anti-sigma factor family protein [Planctomycetota bacterium]